MAIFAMVVAVVAPLRRATEPTSSERLYHRAMRESGHLLDLMRRPHPVRAVIVEIMARQDDTPFLASVFESVAEASTPKASPEN